MIGPFHLRFAPEPSPSVNLSWTTLHEFVDGAPFVAVARRDETYRVRVAGIGDFLVVRGETDVRVEVLPSVEERNVHQAFSDYVLPAAYQLIGVLAFHASATQIGEDVVGFLGTSGRGKSTIAAALAQTGCVFADDCLAVERVSDMWIAHPEGVLPQLRSPSAARFVPSGASAGEKTPFETRLAAESTRLTALYVLEEGATCELIAVRRSEALMHLASHLYRVDWVSRDLLGSELDQLDRLVRDVAVRRLAFARSFEMLPAVAKSVVEDVATLRRDNIERASKGEKR
jgi:hypothetical protein